MSLSRSDDRPLPEGEAQTTAYVITITLIHEMKFAEFFAGQIITAGSCLISETDIVEFATKYDPQWFHTDIDASREGRHQGLIASGWQTCGIAMRLAVEHALHGSESFASPGLAYLNWTHPVRQGDSLSLTATVLETRRSQTQPSLGILRWRWQLFNQHMIEVLDLEATSLFDLSGTTIP
jgi:acyl dehydratase